LNQIFISFSIFDIKNLVNFYPRKEIFSQIYTGKKKKKKLSKFPQFFSQKRNKILSEKKSLIEPKTNEDLQNN
jgi:hypothetical protein